MEDEIKTLEIELERAAEELQYQINALAKSISEINAKLEEAENQLKSLKNEI